MKKLTLLIFANAIAMNFAFSQGTAINTSGVSADNSAILDITDTTKGLLIPRMTIAQRTAIVSPSKSLLIYQTDAGEGYYFNSGTPVTPVWVKLSADNLGNHTASDSLNMNNLKIYNLATCTQNLDAANKLYVDSKVAAGGGGGGCVSVPSMISSESASAYTVSAAVYYCDTMKESGFTDWRLPTVDEIAYFFGSSASTNYLWTKSLADGREDASIQYNISARLSDGKFRNGYDLSAPFVGRGVSGSTSGATWATLGTLNPVTAGNWLMVTSIFLSGTNSTTTYLSAFRIKFNYASGSSSYSPPYYSFAGNTTSFSWDNISNPIALSSIALEAQNISVTGIYAYGSLTVSGYETAPQVQKDGSTLRCRCVR